MGRKAVSILSCSVSAEECRIYDHVQSFSICARMGGPFSSHCAANQYDSETDLVAAIRSGDTDKMGPLDPVRTPRFFALVPGLFE